MPHNQVQPKSESWTRFHTVGIEGMQIFLVGVRIEQSCDDCTVKRVGQFYYLFSSTRQRFTAVFHAQLDLNNFSLSQRKNNTNTTLTRKPRSLANSPQQSASPSTPAAPTTPKNPSKPTSPASKPTKPASSSSPANPVSTRNWTPPKSRPRASATAPQRPSPRSLVLSPWTVVWVRHMVSPR